MSLRYRPRGPHVDWDSEERLGRIPDTILAMIHGCHSTTVAKARWDRGIPPVPNANASCWREVAREIERGISAMSAHEEDPEAVHATVRPAHWHVCPWCRRETGCAADCRPLLEDDRGMMIGYQTCRICLEKISSGPAEYFPQPTAINRAGVFAEGFKP